MTTVSCRKCAQPITGQAFGSESTGWEHPFECPMTHARALYELEELRKYVVQQEADRIVLVKERDTLQAWINYLEARHGHGTP